MIEFAVRPPTIPIPFHKLLKVDAIVDPEAPQIRSHQIADIAVLGTTSEVDGCVDLGPQTPAVYAKQIAASSGEIEHLYAKWFGEPDEDALTFFRWNTLPE